LKVKQLLQPKKVLQACCGNEVKVLIQQQANLKIEKAKIYLIDSHLHPHLQPRT